ncbi:hypothetical protein FVE85_0554 [Porphyridium purpureum]|uniref:Uncharacterized protein n=1 Tax=Porphyridium purpureum TaxID=35688 RepID=A0A5J4Z086_PORPP|nr:hypothetical protein FVE85_0554 [Porphyridium purpureum]|eukprot:POR7197..scf208_2
MAFIPLSLITLSRQRTCDVPRRGRGTSLQQDNGTTWLGVCRRARTPPALLSAVEPLGEQEDLIRSLAEDAMDEWIAPGDTIALVGRTEITKAIIQAMDRKVNAGMLADVRLVPSAASLGVFIQQMDYGVHEPDAQSGTELLPASRIDLALVAAERVDHALNFSLPLSESLCMDVQTLQAARDIILVVPEEGVVVDGGSNTNKESAGFGSFFVEILPLNVRHTKAYIERVLRDCLPNAEFLVCTRFQKTKDAPFETVHGHLILDVIMLPGHFVRSSQVHRVSESIQAIVGVTACSLQSGCVVRSAVVGCHDVVYMQPSRIERARDPEFVNMKLNEDETERREMLATVSSRWELYEHEGHVELRQSFCFTSAQELASFTRRLLDVACSLKCTPRFSVDADAEFKILVRLFSTKYSAPTTRDILLAEEVASWLPH